jgi:DNA repair photolyase
MFYHRPVRAEYRLEPCRSALNSVRGMPFRWSLNPYMGCVHRCTFCYVRLKVNVAEVLRQELARPSWEHEPVALGTATDPYQPAEGRFRLTLDRSAAMT